MGILGIGLFLLLILGILAGPVDIPPKFLLGALVHPDSGVVSTIVWAIRMPRVGGTVLVGAALGGAGAVMQGLLRNPLADPYVVGASAGAGFGAAVAGYLWPGMVMMAPGAFLGAVGTVALSYALSARYGRLSSSTLLLAGYALGTILAALTTILLLLNQADWTRVIAWELGGLRARSFVELGVAAGLMLLALIVLWPLGRHLNAMLLGEEQAEALGIPLLRTKAALLLGASLFTAAAVYLGGVIGFVGLVVPHMLRPRVGSDHRWLVPASFLAGADLLLAAEIIAEKVPGMGSLPVGVLTALLGGPYFLWLLTREAPGEGGRI